MASWDERWLCTHLPPCLLLPPKFKKYVCYLRSSISFLFIVKCWAWVFIFLTHFKLFHLIEIRNKCPSHSSHYSTFSFPQPLVMGLFFTFWIFCIGIYIGWLKKQNNQKKHVSQVCSCYSPKNEWWTEPFRRGKCPGPLAWPRRDLSPRPGGTDPVLALYLFLQFMPLFSLLFSQNFWCFFLLSTCLQHNRDFLFQ